MARKSSTVIKGINNKPTKSGGVKIEKPLGVSSKEKQTKGISNAARKPVLKERIQNQIMPKSLSIKHELNQRVAELQIINSIQQGLASRLDMQSIYDLVGDKIREIFNAQVVVIGIRNPKNQHVHFPYSIALGKRFKLEPQMQDDAIVDYWIRMRQPFLINENFPEKWAEIGMGAGLSSGPKSYLAVPMFIGDTLRGGISLQNLETEQAFSESDVQLLQTLVSSMSVALENAHLFKAEQERVAELAVINSVQEGLVAHLDFNAIIHLVGNRLYEIFKVSTVQINIYDPASGLLHTPYCFEEGNLHTHEARAPRALEIPILGTKQTIVINENLLEIARQNGIESPPAGKMPKSIVDVPLVVKGEARGYISLQDNEHEHTFTESVVRLVTTLANSMSVALENARLFDETQRLLKITEDRAAELAIINSVQAALAAELNIQGIYDAVGDKIREITGSEIVMIQIWDIEKGVRHDEYSFEKGKRFPISEHPFTPLEKSMIPDLQSGKTIAWNEGMEERIRKLSHSHVVVGVLPLSVVVVPLKTGKTDQKAITAISLQNSREYAFSDSDVRLIETLANAMSVALQNARLFNETQRLLKDHRRTQRRTGGYQQRASRDWLPSWSSRPLLT